MQKSLLDRSKILTQKETLAIRHIAAIAKAVRVQTVDTVPHHIAQCTDGRAFKQIIVRRAILILGGIPTTTEH